ANKAETDKVNADDDVQLPHDRSGDREKMHHASEYLWPVGRCARENTGDTSPVPPSGLVVFNAAGCRGSANPRQHGGVPETGLRYDEIQNPAVRSSPRVHIRHYVSIYS